MTSLRDHACTRGPKRSHFLSGPQSLLFVTWQDSSCPAQSTGLFQGSKEQGHTESDTFMEGAGGPAPADLLQRHSGCSLSTDKALGGAPAVTCLAVTCLAPWLRRPVPGPTEVLLLPCFHVARTSSWRLKDILPAPPAWACVSGKKSHHISPMVTQSAPRMPDSQPPRAPPSSSISTPEGSRRL